MPSRTLETPVPRRAWDHSPWPQANGPYRTEFRLAHRAGADAMAAHPGIERWQAAAVAVHGGDRDARRVRLAGASLIWADLTQMDDHVSELAAHAPRLADTAANLAMAGRTAGTAVFVTRLDGHRFWRGGGLGRALVWLAANRLRSDTVLVQSGLTSARRTTVEALLADGFEELGDGSFYTQEDPRPKYLRSIAALERADRVLAHPAVLEWLAHGSRGTPTGANAPA